MTKHPEIIHELPHRPPFRFVTRVGELEPGLSGQGVWDVTGDEDFFAGHFPGRPIVPGVLIGEALAQFAGLVGLQERDEPVDGRLARIELRFDRAVIPPAEIHLHARLLRKLGALSLYEVRAEVSGDVAARGTLTLAAMPPEAAPGAAR